MLLLVVLLWCWKSPHPGGFFCYGNILYFGSAVWDGWRGALEYLVFFFGSMDLFSKPSLFFKYFVGQILTKRAPRATRAVGGMYKKIRKNCQKSEKSHFLDQKITPKKCQAPPGRAFSGHPLSNVFVPRTSSL